MDDRDLSPTSDKSLPSLDGSPDRLSTSPASSKDPVSTDHEVTIVQPTNPSTENSGKKLTDSAVQSDLPCDRVGQSDQPSDRASQSDQLSDRAAQSDQPSDRSGQSDQPYDTAGQLEGSKSSAAEGKISSCKSEPLSTQDECQTDSVKYTEIKSGKASSQLASLEPTFNIIPGSSRQSVGRHCQLYQ